MTPSDVARALKAQAISTSDQANNQQAVAGLLAHKLTELRNELPRSSASGSSSSKPAPGCPMHIADASSLPSSRTKISSNMMASSGGQCPIPHDDRDAYLAARSSTQQDQTRIHSTSPTQKQDKSSAKPWSSVLNPLNMMPSFSQDKASEQQAELSIERVVSSIPRARSSPAPGASPYDSASACPVKQDGSTDQTDKWEYPSPQQFYNALVRKGWETPEEHVETMVMVHNFLNEQAWLEVLEWEKLAGANATQAELARFQGKPGTLTPKARMFGWLSVLMPNTFSSEPPFDRHDWVVRRPDQAGREVRYVIDYYSVPDDPTKDEPEFVLDVRPALDSFESLSTRLRKGFNEWRGGNGFFAAFAAENMKANSASST